MCKLSGMVTEADHQAWSPADLRPYADTVLDAFAVVARPGEAGQEIHRRFGALIDRYTLYAPYALDDEVRRHVVTSLHKEA